MRFVRTMIAALVCVPAIAHADSPDHDKAVALFDDARKLIDDNQCDAAMPKLEMSLRYEPSVGAHLSKADCLESHDPLEAWTQLREAQRLAYLKHDDRTKIAQDRATALESKLPMVRIVLPADVVRQPGLEVRVDGVLVDSFFYDSGTIALKAGPHVVEATLPNRKWSQQVVAQAGATTSVNAQLAQTCAAPAGTGALMTRPLEAQHDPGSAQRTIGLLLGGVGVAALGVGGIFGGAALAKKGDIDTSCGGSAQTCTAAPGSVDMQRSEQQNYARLSTLGFVVGGVAVAAGIVLYLTAPHAKTTVAVTGSLGGVSLMGRFQ
jgi:hypothetical protein